MKEEIIQVSAKDLIQIKKDIEILKNLILSGKVKIDIVDDLEKEFQELDSLSDEALNNF